MTIDITKASKWMARERKWAKEYVVRESGKPFMQQSREELAGYAVGKLDVGYASTALTYLAGVHGASGCSAVVSGDEDGFAEIDLACLENYWAIRLLYQGYQLDQRPDKHARTTMEIVATCWMHAEAIGAVAIRSWLDALVIKLDGGDASISGKDMSPLCTLVAHFVTGRDARTLERLGWAPIAIYQRVADRSLTVSDYDTLSVFHQNGVDGDGFPPFHFYPYRLVPFELLAIAKRTGVALAGRHPLLNSPLARVRTVAEIAMTEELRAVVTSRTAEVVAEQL